MSIHAYIEDPEGLNAFIRISGDPTPSMMYTLKEQVMSMHKEALTFRQGLLPDAEVKEETTEPASE